MLKVFIILVTLCSFFIIDKQIIDLKQYEKATLKVEVKGNVANPGIFELNKYSVVNDVLNEAIVLEDSDLSSINLNMILQDNDVIYVPAKSEIVKISINSATVEQLSTLDGIGEKTALKIVKYRNEHGFFNNIEDLMLIPGIKQAKFDKIKDHISL